MANKGHEENTRVDGEIHLAIPADDRYWRQALVTAASAVRGSSLPVVVHILDGGISEEHKSSLSQVLQTVVFHSLDMAKLSKHGQWHGSAVAWSRLWLAEILPGNVEWVISCDADVLFRGDIAKLWALRDEKLLVQGSRDSLPLWMTKNPTIASWCEKTGKDYGNPAMFFCSGITMMNLKGIRGVRGQGLGVRTWQEELEQFAEDYSDVPFLDQTALNLVFADRKGILPRNWGCFSGDQNADVDYNGDCAIHYVNDQPWERRKLTQLVSDVTLLWWREAGRVQSSVFRVQSLGVYGCRNWADYAWRRGLWLALKATSGLWRHFDGFAWHFRNALPRPKNSKLQTLNSKLSSLRLVWWTRGANTHHTTLLTALRARGVDVEACYYHGRYSSYRLQMGWKDPELKPWEHYASTIRAAKKLIPDFSERMQMVAGYSDAVNWKTIFWCLLHRKPWFVVTEGTSGSWKSWPVFKLFAWLVNRFAIGIFPLGQEAVEQFRRAGVREEKIVPFYYATMMPGGQVEVKGGGGEWNGCVFVFAGEFCRRKGVDILAAAWKKMHARYPNTRLVVAGGDVVKDVDTSFLSGEGVEYIGAVPQEKVYDVICRGDVMLLPSRYDPWGAALVEGAAAGLAMIGSDKTGAAVELIKEGENGYLVKAGDIDSLATALSRYAADVELAHQHGTAAKAAAQVTSGDVLAEKMVDYFERRLCV